MRKAVENIAQKYKNILDIAEPYILSHHENFRYFDTAPWGIEIPEANRISCLSMKHEKFFDLILALDRLTYKEKLDSTTDKWIFFDCAEMPGGIFGFAVKANLLDRAVLKKYDAPSDYEGLIPISMVGFIPKISRDEWWGFIIASVSWLLAENLSGLGLLTHILGAKTFNIKCVSGPSQWGRGALNIFSQAADMEILSAYTPAHTFKNTVVFKSVYTDKKLLDALSGKPRKADKWDFLYPADDEKFSVDIQEKIEKGAKYTIVGRPVIKDGRTFYPVSENK